MGGSFRLWNAVTERWRIKITKEWPALPYSRGAPSFFSVIACMDCVRVWPGIGLGGLSPSLYAESRSQLPQLVWVACPLRSRP